MDSRENATTTSSTPKLRPLSVSTIEVHVSVKDRARRRASPESLHQVASISVACNERQHFEVTAFTKAAAGREPTEAAAPELRLHSLTEASPATPETAYRVTKQLVDFQVFRSQLRRAVQVTHLLSSCSFCKAIKVVCTASEKELGYPTETSSGQDTTDLSLQQFTNDVLALVVAHRRPSVCFGKLQCWVLLSRFLLLQTAQSRGA